MCALLRFSVGGLAAVLTTAYVAASAETGMSAFQPTVMVPAPVAQTVINRANKGDREVTIRDARPVDRVKPAKLMEGCDPAFSPLMASSQNNFTNRCVV